MHYFTILCNVDMRCCLYSSAFCGDKMAAVASISNSEGQCVITILRYNDEIGEWQTVKTQKVMGYSRFGKYLVEAGADINPGNFEGGTPLAVARAQGHNKVAALLERAGATE